MLSDLSLRLSASLSRTRTRVVFVPHRLHVSGADAAVGSQAGGVSSSGCVVSHGLCEKDEQATHTTSGTLRAHVFRCVGVCAASE